MLTEHSHIIRIQGDIITVPAREIGYGELAQVKSRHGVSLAQVIRLKGHDVFYKYLPDHGAFPRAIRSVSSDTPCAWLSVTPSWAEYSTVPANPSTTDPI